MSATVLTARGMMNDVTVAQQTNSSSASLLMGKDGGGANDVIASRPAEDNYDYVSYLDDVSAVLVPWSEDRAYLPTMLTYGLTLVCGVTGNVLMIARLLATARRQRHKTGDGRRNVTSVFLLSLALSDLVFVIFCVPYDVSAKMLSHWSAGVVMCKMSTYVEMMCAEATVLCLTAVSIERHIVIVYPMRAREWCRARNYRRAVAAVWLGACLLSAPALLLVDTTRSLFYNNASHVTLVACAEVGSPVRLVIAWYQVMVMFVLPTLVIGCCSVSVVRVLWRSTKAFQRLTSTSGTYSRQSSNASSKILPPARSSVKSVSSMGVGVEPMGVIAARKQVIKLLLVIAVVFLLCWAPKCMLNMMRRYSLDILHCDGAFYFMLAANLLPFVHSCLNPLLYGLMAKGSSRAWRCCARRLAASCQRCCWHHAPPPPPSGDRSISETDACFSASANVRRHPTAMTSLPITCRSVALVSTNSVTYRNTTTTHV